MTQAKPGALERVEELALLAVRPSPSQEDAERALRLIWEGVGGAAAFFVYGAEDDFHCLPSGPPLELSRTALWLINRDLTANGGLRGFQARYGRVQAFAEAASGAPSSVAALVPAGRSSANMLLVQGPWPEGLGLEARTFLTAALPALGLLMGRRLALAAAEEDHAQLSTLVSVGRVISESEELEVMLTSIAKMAARLTGIDYVTIDIVRRDGSLALRCVNYDAPRAESAGDRWRKSAARPDLVRNMVVATRMPLIFADAQTDERLPEATRAFFTRTLIRSAALFPLPARDEVLGVLSVASLRPREFQHKERDLLEGLAGQIAIAVKGVQLFEERRRAEEELRRTQDLLTATIESTADGILVVDSAGRVAYSNARFAEIWSIPPEILGGGDDDAMLQYVLEQLVDPAAFLDRVRYLYGTTLEDFDTLLFQDGSVIERYSRPLLAEAEAAGRVWSFRDVTERKKHEETLIRQARHDALTQLLNHAAITEALHDLAGRCTSAGVIVCDVDGMKAVNDTYGHLVGDEVLVTVARTLAREGAIVGRYGGDEFLVVLSDADRPSTENYCRAVLDDLAGARVRDPQTGASVPVIASLGIAVFPSEAETVEDAIRLADNAMYSEKRERSAAGSLTTTRGGLGDERAAKMIGELVPMLTSPGRLDEKLRMVAHQLSVGAGYDIVRFDLLSPKPGAAASSTFARLPAETIEEWERASMEAPQDAFVEQLRETRRPQIVDDLLADPRYSERQREILQRMDVRSALIVPMMWQDEFVGVLSVAVKQQGALDARDARFLASVSDQVTAIIRMETLLGDLESATHHLQEARGDTVVLLAAAAEAHDHTTGRHLHRVQLISELIARELGYPEDEVAALGLAAVLHDIGKIRVPESILLSPSRLNGEEWALMKQHTVWGAEFLSERPGFELAATIARAHHEQWDGTGYPAGLVGEEIPEVAAIVSVADALDAITNDRPYRAGQSVAWAMTEIQRCSGTQLNPRVVEALVRLYERDRAVFAGFGPAAPEAKAA